MSQVQPHSHMNARIMGVLSAAGETALVHFGAEKQKIQALEEMGELIRVLAKDVGKRQVKKEAIIDEVADVLIMSHQLRIIFGAREVDDQIVMKLEKLMERIRSKHEFLQGETSK